jgi:hypothetical protein|tara:strand:+ start:8031 stop:8210 length:180 start_codon:yes stop_codon:yes gene_type:complete
MDRIKASVNKTITTVNGALYENSIVILDQLIEKDNKIRVTDTMGKIFWVSINDITIIKP